MTNTNDIVGKRIEEIAHDARLHFIASTQLEPEIMYLGRKEIRELKEWAHEQYIYIDPPNEQMWEAKNRPEVFGMLVYQVNADSHFYIA